MKSWTATVLVVAFALTGHSPAAAQGGGKRNIRVNETRDPVRTPDMSPLGKEASSEVLAGPTNGSNNGYLIFTRMPAGAHGPALFTLPDEHFYLVLEGKMNIQIGSDRFVVNKYEGVQIPPNTPHEVWNADAEPEMHVEVIAPGSSRDLMSMFKPAQARKVENAAQYIRAPRLPAMADLKPGLNGAAYASRQTGATIQMRVDSTRPGQGGPKTHVHKFQQVYWSIDGSTTVEYGLFNYPLPKYSLVVIQPGVVHTNYNKTNTMERHITLLMPELPEGEPADVEYERKAAPAPGRGR
jgi:mannose-6-phosphate isomerase-like protein (cupin superfamily)